MPKASPSKINYIKEYQKKNYTNISFKVRTIEDKDIIDYLNSVPNKSVVIKEALKKVMYGEAVHDQD